jgi:serine/threonine protein kinase
VNYKQDLSNIKKICVLGEGNNGKVYFQFITKVFLIKCIREQKQYALKVINKAQLIDENMFRYLTYEKFIMEQIDNKFLLKSEGFFQTRRNIFFVMDDYRIDLYNLLQQEKTLSEYAVAFYSLCIAIALECLHNHKFVFRDLKPENILLGDDGYPVLCDFGLCNLMFPSNKAYTLCGTQDYFAPEIIISNSYDNRVDWWGLGILM